MASLIWLICEAIVNGSWHIEAYNHYQQSTGNA